MKTVTFKLDDSLSARLDEAARERSMTRSDLIRLSLEVYLGRGNEPLPGSFLALARDFIGCLEGPGDLSTDPDALKEFGK